MAATFRAVLDEMEHITTKEQATELVERLTAETLSSVPNMTELGAREVTLSSIGYMTGYLNRTEAGRLLELFETKHPYFGAIEEWPDNPEEILLMGMELGRKAKAGKL